MPWKTLLRQKSFRRKRSPSTDSNSAPGNQEAPSGEPVPPLPQRKHSPSNGDDEHADRPYTNGTESTFHPRMSPPNGHGSQEDLDKELAAPWSVVNQTPKTSKTDKVLQTLEGAVLRTQSNPVNSLTVLNGIATVLEVTGGMEAIEHGVNTFLEGSTVLMNALDEVAKLHPFVGVAVMAFKTVWTLEMKRRENDKKIIALYVEMRDMMAVLIQLKNVKDVDETAPDGSTIKGRLQELAHGTAEDIKKCTNACDTYSKKKLVVKILKGPIWEGRLLSFVALFTKRRSEFEFALTVHTSRGVDAANETLGDVEKTAQEMNAKMDLMIKMFQNFALPEERAMTLLVDQKGGIKTCQDDDKILKELNDMEVKSASPAAGGAHAGRNGTNKPSDLDALKEDLHVDPDVAMEKNMVVFSRKFELQKRQIIDELSHVVQRESDRVISAVTAGPHDKIIDPDVHEIWKVMGWRGSVKARHFVLALRDYFQEKWGLDTPAAHQGTTASADNSDEWAIAYLNVMRLQQISEAFDDDASGFVTVAEVNMFTTSRPLDWSLPHWIAYWAIGWHQSMTDYAQKIRELIAKMFSILPNILPANRASTNTYLNQVYEYVTTLEASLIPCYINDALQTKFKSYVEAEESRLGSMLDAVDYDIDAMDTLGLVTGQGRIDRFVLPLLYLLLKRHFEIFRVCQSRVVHPDELWDAADTIEWVCDAVDERVSALQSVFMQQKVNLKQQFKTFAHGLFQYMNEPNGLWDPKVVQKAEVTEYPYDEKLEAKDVDIKGILNYPLDQEDLDFAAYDPPVHDGSVPDSPLLSPPLNAVLGRWNGFGYWPASSNVPSSGMISINLLASTTDGRDGRFQASDRANFSDFTISGECSPGETGDTVNISFKRSFQIARFSDTYYYGSWDAATDSLTGSYGLDADRSTHRGFFMFKRTAPQHLRFRPANSVFQSNKPRALWLFGISAIRHEILQISWSSSFFKKRRDDRKRFIELYIRNTRFGRPLEQAELVEFGRIKQKLTTADSRFYHSLAEHQIQITTGHGVYCDSCGGTVGGARISCLTCQTKDTFDTLDLCEAPQCVVAQVEREDLTRPHLPTHDLVKLRRIVHIRQFGKTYREAKEALKTAREIFAQSGQTSQSTNQINGRGSDSGPRSHMDSRLSDSQDLSGPDTGPVCAVCERPVTQPCWYCVQCEDDTFICDDCDAKGSTSFGNHDMNTHDLVRCHELVKDADVSMEDSLAELERRFAEHEKTMDERIGQLDSRVNDRLSRVETLLERILGKVGAEPV